MAERRTISSMWGNYQRNVLPPEAGPEQLIETRRAFYAGAHAFFLLISGGLDNDANPTPADVAYVESLRQEVGDFVQQVGSDRA
jgi:hypothetical protein